MKVLVFDTETTGLPKEKNASIYQTELFPHIVQLSYILYDTDTNEPMIIVDNIIKIDETVELPEESVAIHKITRQMTRTKGIHIKSALARFNYFLNMADIAIAHNIKFDKKVIMVECIRNKIAHCFKNIKEYCTCMNGIEICKIPKVNDKGETYFKYPRLSELHQKLFNYVPDGTHNALIDVLLCLRCYVYINYNGYDALNNPKLSALLLN
jgi:DNA polymerase-3 subunit epsilon